VRSILVKTNYLKAFIAFAAAALAARASEAPKPCCAPETAGVAAAPKLSTQSLYQVESFWTDDSARVVKLASLRGKPVVLAMFFTSCENACPIIVSQMERIWKALPAAHRTQTRLVLVSFDSDRDTPEVLHLYRSGMRLGDEYTLLHGEPDEVRELAMLLGVKYAKDIRGQFAHSNLITVLNTAGEIAFQRQGLTSDITATANAVIAAAQ
jgi:protein SCO1/2